MQVTELFTDDDAVSSVVSTVLMVAITIILVAVIGSFVLDLGGAVGESPPSTRLSVVEQQFNGSDTAVLISHEGGDTLDESQVTVTVNGKMAKNGTGSVVWGGSGGITAGDQVNVTQYGSSNQPVSTTDRVLVVWEAESGDTSIKLFDHVVRS